MVHVNIKDGLTSRQIERQKVREKGKYSKYGTCEICGKKIRPGEYSSDERCNATGYGLLLCGRKCGIKADKMNNREFVEILCKDASPESKKEFLARLKKEFPKHE
jgi:hypothetical protein